MRKGLVKHTVMHEPPCPVIDSFHPHLWAVASGASVDQHRASASVPRCACASRAAGGGRTSNTAPTLPWNSIKSSAISGTSSSKSAQSTPSRLADALLRRPLLGRPREEESSDRKGLPQVTQGAAGEWGCRAPGKVLPRTLLHAAFVVRIYPVATSTVTLPGCVQYVMQCTLLVLPGGNGSQTQGNKAMPPRTASCLQTCSLLVVLTKR